MDALAANIALAAQPLPSWIKAALFTLTLVFSALLLDHGFGLPDAAALLAELARNAPPAEERARHETIMAASTFEGWGKERQAAHARLMRSLPPSSREPDAPMRP